MELYTFASGPGFGPLCTINAEFQTVSGGSAPNPQTGEGLQCPSYPTKPPVHSETSLGHSPDNCALAATSEM